MTTQESRDDVDSAESAAKAETPETAEPTGGWPELDKLVDEIKTKRSEELARQEEQRSRQQKAAQDAERAWANINAKASLDEMAARLQDLGVVARPVETLAGASSAALELTRLPKGESATIRIDTTPSRSGPARTTVQVQRGSQQMPAVIIASNTAGELRKSLVDIAQKLLG